MAKAKLPKLKEVLDGTPSVHAGLPTLKQVLGAGSGLPTLTQSLTEPSVSGGAHHSGGGFLGGIEHAGHWVGEKTGLAAHDIKAIPAGVVQQTKVVGEALPGVVEHPLRNSALWQKYVNHNKHPTYGPKQQELVSTFDAQVHGSKEALEHPLRDPLQTALIVAPVLHGLGKVADVASGGRIIGDAATPRMLKVGKADIPLHTSTNPAYRVVQGAYDQVMQRALDRNPEGRIAQHAVKRAAGSIAETERYRQRMRDVPANMLNDAAGRLARPGQRASRRIQQAALELTSVNTAPEDAAAFHRLQAKLGVNQSTNTKIAALYDRVASARMLRRDEHGNVVVDAARYPRLARADAELARVQSVGDQILEKHDVMSKEGLAARRNAPGRIRAGGIHVDQPLNDVAKTSSELEAIGQLSLHPRTVEEHVGTGIVGGDEALPGRGYVSYKTELPKASRTAIARSIGRVIGKTRSPITSHEFTGSGIEQGFVPENVTRTAAQHLHALNRFVNTDALRRQIAATGSDVRRTSRDVLIRLPDQKASELSQRVKQIIGKTQSSIDDPETLHATLEDYKQHLLPGIAEKFRGDKRTAIGAPAPQGFRWVDQKLLGPLHEDVVPRGKPGRIADQLNSAVTAATVYLKPGHIGTRVLTNLATNVIQGSWADAISNRTLWDKLSTEDRMRALAASGQHGYAAMPHEGTGWIADFARKGSNFWAKHADQAFRANSILYEARKAGFNTPEKFHAFLDALESHGEGMNAAQWAKVDWIAKRANRAAIAYDRLNPAERRYFARAVWFYPFQKGAAMFTGHTLVEHPYKAAALGQAGVEGREEQLESLGLLSSYAQGNFKIGGNSWNPLVTDFSTFSPFATTGDLLELGPTARGADLLNPVYSAGVQLLGRENQYGEHSNHPFTDALSTLVSPAPEAQIAGAALHPTNGMYVHNWRSALLRALIGPAAPRHMNRAKANRAYELELKGR